MANVTFLPIPYPTNELTGMHFKLYYTWIKVGFPYNLNLEEREIV